MGIYDRQYYSEYDRPEGIQLGGSRMLVTNLVIVNVAIFLIDLFFTVVIQEPDGARVKVHALTHFFQLEPNLLVEPWKVYQLLSYGFLHSTTNMLHVVFNMLGLWMLGREVEIKYGKKQFLQFYLSTIVLAENSKTV